MSGSARLRFDDMRGIFALMPTPATDDGSDVDAEFTVDLDEARRAARTLASDGVDGIMINGTLGEAATLTEAEWREFTKTVVDAVGGKVYVIAGPTTLNTRDTVRRARYAREVGADGILLGRPMWCELSQDATVEFYRAVARAVPELGIVVYDNPLAFRNRISLEAWRALARIPQIVGAKYSHLEEEPFRKVVEATRGSIRIMPIERDWLTAYRLFPDYALACWSVAASCGPLPVVMLKEAIMKGDTERATAITERIKKTYERFFPRGDRQLFGMYNIALEKIRIDAAGYIRAGPIRPPYHVIPEEFAEGARITGRRWRELVEELRARGLT